VNFRRTFPASCFSSMSFLSSLERLTYLPLFCLISKKTGHQNLHPPAGNKVASHVYAEGVQIYRWDGTSWVFLVPDALLFADAGYEGIVGIHYAGPTWESVSGGKVAGTVFNRCTPESDAIPWLLLRAVFNEGPGIFHRVTFIQRVNTVGGIAPTDPGNFIGEVVRVPYTAEYFFYRAHH
jgi:Protein of unknown function (DUF3455)